MCAYRRTHIRKICSYNTRMRSSNSSELHFTCNMQSTNFVQPIWNYEHNFPLNCMTQDPITVTHSLTHTCYAGWHIGRRQRYSTPFCFGPASEQYLRYGGGSWGPLLQFDARCSCIFPLVSSEGLCGRCCLALFSSHVLDNCIYSKFWH